MRMPPIGTNEPAEPTSPLAAAATDVAGKDIPADALQTAQKPRLARFDFAGANQAHRKSMSAMRGQNAGPMKKAPPRR